MVTKIYEATGYSELTPCPLGDVAVISNVWISNTRWELISLLFQVDITLQWMPSGNKPMPEPMFTKISNLIFQLQATVS